MSARIHRYDVVDSTSERAFASLEEGTARDGDVHVAQTQTQGRGRLGRRWESAPGEGLYVSVVLLPPPPPIPPAALTVASGLATLAAVRDLGAKGVALEWPNDVLLDGSKLAGILVETRGLDPGRPHYVVGVGLNVRQRAFPDSLTSERAVTSLLLAGVDVDVSAAEEALLARLPERLREARSDRARLAADFLLAADLTGRPVRVELADETLSCEILELSLDDGILLRPTTGGERRVPIELVRDVVG